MAIPTLTPNTPPNPLPNTDSDTYEVPDWEQSYGEAESYFDPTKGTVEGRLQGLLENPNPVMKKAEAGAMRGANARGLLNSSISAEAGQSALIGAAMPIAQQDADTYRQMYAKDAEYDMEKDFEFQSQRFQKMMQSMTLDVEQRMQERGIASDERMQERGIAAEKNLQDKLLAAQEKIKTLEISSEEKQMMASAYSAVVNNIITQIGGLWRDKSLKSDAIFGGIDEMLGNLDDAFATIADLFGYSFDFS